ncbi:uncharacterized protein LOC110859585 isoform X2 [Folsomia candida]|uniref:Uncharacterized protein n=1 Tax=Folsomia candida TaxID=158441 RepID=A0A226D8P2_FOLCA|nr:uncharacterized protein LOC110859585 isoform X2 [Folsomia candida]OXA41925.1 hypothetical protein Fcan01_23094 [Folsomia candida]
MEPQTTTNLALSNPIILTTILKQRSTPLTNCRLVSHFWNDIVLSLPNTRFGLKLDHKNQPDSDHDHDPIPFFDMCFTLDPRLAKRINATCRTDVSHSLTSIYSFSAKLLHLSDKFSDKIQILDVCIEYENCLDSVYRALKNWCPNLKEIRITCPLEVNINVNLVPVGGPVLYEELDKKSNLTVFSVSSKKVEIPRLASFIRLVVNASPNLKEIKIPLGFCPDFGNSKCLESLRISLDGAQPIDLARAILDHSELSRMLEHVKDQLVTLAFGYVEDGMKCMQGDYKELKRVGFKLGRKFPKLRNLHIDIVDVFEMTDFIQSLEGMQALERLEIGKTFRHSTCVDKLLHGICESGKIFASVTNLRVKAMDDVLFYEGRLKTGFPNVARLQVDMLGTEGMRLASLFRALCGWRALKHLNLTVPIYHVCHGLFFRVLLLCKELYQQLKSLELNAYHKIQMTTYLTEGEMELFEQVLIAMDELDDVKISNLSPRTGLCKYFVMLKFLISNDKK